MRGRGKGQAPALLVAVLIDASDTGGLLFAHPPLKKRWWERGRTVFCSTRTVHLQYRPRPLLGGGGAATDHVGSNASFQDDVVVAQRTNVAADTRWVTSAGRSMLCSPSAGTSRRWH